MPRVIALEVQCQFTIKIEFDPKAIFFIYQWWQLVFKHVWLFNGHEQWF